MKRTALVLLALALITGISVIGCTESSQPLTPIDSQSKLDRTVQDVPQPPPVYLSISSGVGTVSRRMDLDDEQALTLYLEADGKLCLQTVTGYIQDNTSTTVASVQLTGMDFYTQEGTPVHRWTSDTVTLSSGVYMVYLTSADPHPSHHYITNMEFSVTEIN